MTRTRLAPAVRKDQIMTVAMRLAEQGNYQSVTRDQIANAAGVSVGLVSTHCGTMQNLRRDIMRQAVKNRILRIVAQGLAAGDSHARKAPSDVRADAAKLLGV